MRHHVLHRKVSGKDAAAKVMGHTKETFMEKSKVFEETYNKYLSLISDIDLLPRSAKLGAEQ